MKRFITIVAILAIAFVFVTNANANMYDRMSFATTIGVGLPTGGVDEMNVALIKNSYIMFDLGNGFGTGVHYGGSDYNAESIDELDVTQVGGFFTFKEDSVLGGGVGLLVKLEAMSTTNKGTGSQFGPLAGLALYKPISKHFSFFGGVDWMKIPLADVPVVDVKGVTTMMKRDDITQFGIHAGLSYAIKGR